MGQREVEAEERMETLVSMVAVSLLFGCGIWAVSGFEKAAEYFTGYLVEQSLSIDNLFVFILIFNYFQTPKVYESKVRPLHLIDKLPLTSKMQGVVHPTSKYD